MAVIGYIRVSSNKQSLEHQHFEIEEYAKKHKLTVDDWVEEKISSRKALKTRKLDALLENLQENDILITCEISRLGVLCLKSCEFWKPALIKTARFGR